MSTYDWSRFCTRINVSASLTDLYAAWSTRRGLERWFLRVAEFSSPERVLRHPDEQVQKGDGYRWLWFGYDDTVVERGTILDTNGRDFLRFSFAGTCVVSVVIKREDGETIVELTQENIPLDDVARTQYHLGCITGWTFYLANLKSILEGGIDLRNKNQNLQKVINA